MGRVYDENGNVEQTNNYFAYGGLTNDVTAGTDTQTRKFGGKELDRMHGLDLSDFSARQYDAAIGQFTSMDPLCEKYYHISPYAYCAGNPVRFVDPDGMEVHLLDDNAYQALLQTLHPEDRNYVRLTDSGSIDYGLMSSHESGSENYKALLTMAGSELVFHLGVQNEYEYKNANGTIEKGILSYEPAAEPSDPFYEEFLDTEILSVNGITTGESGHYGQTLLPGYGTSGMNSVNGDTYVYVHSSLSNIGKSEVVSHELFGHAFSYCLFRDRVRAGHNFSVSGRDSNTELRNFILRSRRETVNYFK